MNTFSAGISIGVRKKKPSPRSPHAHRLPLLEPTHEALDRLVGTQKSILLNQIPLSAYPVLNSCWRPIQHEGSRNSLLLDVRHGDSARKRGERSLPPRSLKHSRSSSWGAIAGLRRNEIDKLPWSAFHWGEGVIHIQATEYFRAKAASRKTTFRLILNSWKSSAATMRGRRANLSSSRRARRTMASPIGLTPKRGT